MSLPAEGWHHYLSEPPPAGEILLEWGRYAPLEIFGWKSDGWVWRVICRNDSLPVNIDFSTQGLYWRWTGIGREEAAEALAARPRQQHWALNHVEYDKMFD
jgi:hypothetical protein